MTSVSSERIPVNRPVVEAEDLEELIRWVSSGWVGGGAAVSAFERAVADGCRRTYGVAMSSGTAALEATMEALEIGPGDEVIVPTFTIISCVLAVIRTGATPVLVDADPDTWTMDVAGVRRAISSATRAIMAVHIYGHPVDMDPIHDEATRHGAALIEDAAEAHGAQYLRGHDTVAAAWVPCGSMGSASCLSFYANKLVTTGEGGMVLTDDEELALRLASVRNLGFAESRRFVHERLGHNFRLSNIQAAFGLRQVARLGALVDRKRELGRRYDAGLRDRTELQLPIERPWAQNVYWMYGIVVHEGGPDAATLAERLRGLGVDTRPFFCGMHQQPVLNDLGLFVGESHPVAERLARRGLYLPTGLGLTDSEQDRVIEAVRAALDHT